MKLQLQPQQRKQQLSKKPEIIEEEDQIEEAVEHHSLKDLKPTVGKLHDWKQRGTHIICESCDSTHAFTVPPGTQMVGVDDKCMPIFKN